MEPDGKGGSVRRYSTLALERNTVTFFPLLWTVVHPIDDTSPLAGKTAEELAVSRAEILVLLSGIDEASAQTVHTRSSYRADEIVWNARFQSMFLPVDARSTLAVDITRMHAIEPVPSELGFATGPTGLSIQASPIDNIRSSIMRPSSENRSDE